MVRLASPSGLKHFGARDFMYETYTETLGLMVSIVYIR